MRNMRRWHRQVHISSTLSGVATPFQLLRDKLYCSSSCHYVSTPSKFQWSPLPLLPFSWISVSNPGRWSYAYQWEPPSCLAIFTFRLHNQAWPTVSLRPRKLDWMRTESEGDPSVQERGYWTTLPVGRWDPGMPQTSDYPSIDNDTII